jgi:hypothetical protein
MPQPLPETRRLVAGFYTFALDSFMFGITSGEQVCERAWTETMGAAGMLGIGALGLFTGLAWLLRLSLDPPMKSF